MGEFFRREHLDPISDATSDSYTPATGDENNYLRVTASYTDGEGSGKSAQTESDNTVEAAPVINTAPEFATATSTRTVAENTAAVENIGEPVTATDAEDDTLTYSLGGADAESFFIVPSSGPVADESAIEL